MDLAILIGNSAREHEIWIKLFVYKLGSDHYVCVLSGLCET
jgi:hypothetical protein